MANNKYSQAVIDEAKRLYVNEGFKAQEVSKKLGMTVQTLSAWIKKFRWKEEKYPDTYLNKNLSVGEEIAQHISDNNPLLYERVQQILI